MFGNVFEVGSDDGCTTMKLHLVEKHAYNPSTQKDEARSSQVRSQVGLIKQNLVKKKIFLLKIREPAGGRCSRNHLGD
jgi:hypothetical protein